MGCGDWPRAEQLLGDALRRGERMAELQRLSPALWGLAEAAALARRARALAEVGARPVTAEADRLLAAAAGGRRERPWSPPSAREFEVARLVAAGHTNRELAAKLFLSPKTVAAHVEHILTKLGAARRAEIAAWAAAVATDGPEA
jgi:DNA-binding CsgD family transcriptional regulator